MSSTTRRSSKSPRRWPGTVTISRPVYDALPPRVASIFRFGGIFEEKDFFRTIRRLDTLLCEEPRGSEERLA